MGVNWPSEPPVLSDAVVSLRTPDVSDIDDITAGAQDPDVQKFTMVPRPYLRVHAEEFVEAHNTGAWGMVAPRLGHQGAQPRLNAAFVITGRHGDFRGVIGLHDVDPHNATGEVGYWLGPQARGVGSMSRALGLVLAWAFDVVGLTSVHWNAAQENVASWLVAQRHGFVVDGVTTCGRPGDVPLEAWAATLTRERFGASAG